MTIHANIVIVNVVAIIVAVYAVAVIFLTLPSHVLIRSVLLPLSARTHSSPLQMRNTVTCLWHLFIFARCQSYIDAHFFLAYNSTFIFKLIVTSPPHAFPSPQNYKSNSDTLILTRQFFPSNPHSKVNQ
eukprot:GHVR01033199.1.p1 GENE.GHVR01033199.1~~GHVR01033199.1.p1  ORF type:complete len:129 (+),score=6.94 GHVR01033199.1:404-790(+)